MNPGTHVREGLEPGDSILSLCCGIGIELRKVGEGNPITAVDIAEPYTDEFQKRFPWATVVTGDAVNYVCDMPSDSFDIVSCIDGIEHINKKQGERLLEEMKRVCRKRAFIFTPQGFTKNEPKHTWGIDGGDKHQKHISGWIPQDLKKFGFELIAEADAVSPHGEEYKEGFYVFYNNANG